jgi:predicted lipid-binding transport protein (Tim44 family)
MGTATRHVEPSQRTAQMKMNAQIPQHWWERIRWARQGFFAGLLAGIVLGWFFHGIISFLIRFGLVVVLLLPLLVIGWLWWRSSRSTVTDQPTTTVMTWRSGDIPTRDRARDSMWEPAPDPDGTIPTQGRVAEPPRGAARDSRRPVPSDVEAELDALKREQERRR